MMPQLHTSVDTTGYRNMIAQLAGRINGDMEVLVANEAGHLGMEIGKRLGPADLPTAKRKRDRDMKSQLAVAHVTNIDGHSNIPLFTWLNAGPNFLIGIDDVDNIPNADGQYVMQQFRRNQDKGARGNTYIKFGKRGKQTLQRLNRLRVNSVAYNYVKKRIGERFGILRASFAFAAQVLGVGGRLPDWVTKHFADDASGRAILHTDGLKSPGSPFVEIGSTSPGVETNQKIVSTIQGAVDARQRILATKVKKVIAGYSYDHNTGRVFKPYKDMEIV